MMTFIARLIGRTVPSILEARERDAAAIAKLHAASFKRGWSEEEFHRLLSDRNVVCHGLTVGRTVIGFILSRLAAGESEILSVAIAPAWRGRGFARPLLDLHLRRLAGLGPARYFWRSATTMRPRTAFTEMPDFTRLAGAKATMMAAPRP